MFKVKQEYLDNFNGFSFALLAAMPVIRTDIISAPIYALLLPAMFLYLSTALKLFIAGNKKFKVSILIYFYIIFALFLFLLISSFWSPYNHSIAEDVGKILFILIIALSVLVSFNLKSVEYFFSWLIFFAVIATVLLFFQYVQVGNLRGYNQRIASGYLTRSQLIGMGALVAFTKLLFMNNGKRKFLGLLSLFLFMGLSVALARGAFLSAILLAVFILIYYFSLTRYKSYSITEWCKNKSSRILSVFFLGLVIFAATQIERTAARLMRLFTGNELTAGGRGDLWSNSINGFLDSPLYGFGLGSSGMISIGRSGYYPHNLFLQVMVEGGIIAFFLLLVICLFPILRTYQYLKNGYLNSFVWLPLLTIYIFLFLEFSKSSSFYDARVFISLGIVLIITIEYLKNQTLFSMREQSS